MALKEETIRNRVFVRHGNQHTPVRAACRRAAQKRQVRPARPPIDEGGPSRRTTSPNSPRSPHARLSNRPSYSSISPSASRSRTSRPASQTAVGYGKLRPWRTLGQWRPPARATGGTRRESCVRRCRGCSRVELYNYQRPHSALNQFRPSTTSPPTSACRSGGCLAPSAMCSEPVQLLDRVSAACVGSLCCNTSSR